MDLKGKIKHISDPQTFGSGFKKQELIITTDEQYPQVILIEFHQDRTELLNDLQIGEDVAVSINIRGREWINTEGIAKYFNSIVGWKVSKQNANRNSNQSSPQPTQPGGSHNDYSHSSDELDDLPF